MKKILLALSLVTPLTAFASAAVIDTDAGLCNFDGDFGLTDNTRVVTTYSEDTCDTHLRCKADLEVDLDSAYNNEGFACVVIDADGAVWVTDDSHQVVSKSGKATLQCHVYSCDQLVSPP